MDEDSVQSRAVKLLTYLSDTHKLILVSHKYRKKQSEDVSLFKATVLWLRYLQRQQSFTLYVSR